MNGHATGPKSEAGKLRSKQNAITHGLGAHSLINGESEGDFLGFCAEMRDSLAPVGPLEMYLAERAAALAWRLRRGERAEASLYTRFMKDRIDDDDYFPKATLMPGETEGGAHMSASHTDAFSKISRYETALERSMYRALHELERLQARRMGERVPVPAVIEVNGDSGS